LGFFFGSGMINPERFKTRQIEPVKSSV
jgi:hypothetical protein